MFTQESLKEFTDKFQTDPRNIAREYIQNLFLSSLYKIKHAEKLLFKGGTALRIIYRSPRFSEDLDFTGQNIHHAHEIDELFITVLAAIEKLGIQISFQEAKPTTGGYLGIITYRLFDIFEQMKFEISLRRSRVLSETTTISNEYMPPYTLVQIKAAELIEGKLAALLNRHKARDYYDLYFLLRHPQLNRFVNKKRLGRVSENLEQEKFNFKKELSPLLPASHQMILKDFKTILRKEIEVYL